MKPGSMPGRFDGRIRSPAGRSSRTCSQTAPWRSTIRPACQGARPALRICRRLDSTRHCEHPGGSAALEDGAANCSETHDTSDKTMADLSTRYGVFSVPDAADDMIVRFLRRYGEWAWDETCFIA